jgi:hypothetical protein
VALGYRLIESRVVEMQPLRDVLVRCVPQGQDIDLLSVDVEGLDADVLRSNDWNLYRPRMICVESLRDSSGAPRDRSVGDICRELDYEEVAATFNSRIFRRRDV